jgi:flagella basal body P-ring formation protein FlgA
MRCFFFTAILLLGTVVFSLEVRLKDDIVLSPEQNQLLLSDFVEDAGALRSTGAGDIIFGYAPLPGKTLRVDVEYVVSKFKRYLDDATFVLPEKVVISVYRSVNLPEASVRNNLERESVPVGKSGAGEYDREAIEDMIVSALEERFDVKFDQDFAVDYVDFEQDVFEGEFKQIKLYNQGKNRYMAKIDYSDVSGQSRYLRIVFDCSWMTDIAVCKDDIKKDVLINDVYVRFERLNYFDYDRPVVFADFPDDHVTKYAIKRDDIIEWRMLTKRSYVLKGQIVTAVFNTGGVFVTSQVEILSNAELGQIVKARNLDSGITVTGIVETGPVLKIGY